MKKNLVWMLSLCAILGLGGLCVYAEEPAQEAATEQVSESGSETGSASREGMERTSGGGQVCLLDEMQEQYGMHEDGDVFVYTPTDPKPLNVFIFAHPDSEIGINMDGIHTLDEVDVYTISDRMLDWSYDLSAASNDALQFVFDPNDADVLVIVRRNYPFYATYSSASGQTAAGHSCTETLTAVQLTDPSNRTSISDTNTPGDTVTTSGGSKFWEPVPELEDQLPSFVQTIMGWYGYNAEKGSSGSGVQTAQQSLIDRGFLEGTADGAFGPMTEEAVKKLQADYGLEETGVIDRDTLVALYYNKDAVDALPEIATEEVETEA